MKDFSNHIQVEHLGHLRVLGEDKSCTTPRFEMMRMPLSTFCKAESAVPLNI